MYTLTFVTDGTAVSEIKSNHHSESFSVNIPLTSMSDNQSNGLMSVVYDINRPKVTCFLSTDKHSLKESSDINSVAVFSSSDLYTQSQCNIFHVDCSIKCFDKDSAIVPQHIAASNAQSTATSSASTNVSLQKIPLCITCLPTTYVAGNGSLLCSICGDTFVYAAYLRQHIKQVHSGAVFDCSQCPITCSNKMEQEKHHLMHMPSNSGSV